MSNFAFLQEHDPLFCQLATSAESSFASDPNTTLIKLRQLGEALAQDLAVRCGIEFDDKTGQADLLFKLNREIRLETNVAELFHTLRIEGNRATHQFKTQHKEALDGLLWIAIHSDPNRSLIIINFFVWTSLHSRQSVNM